MIVYIVFSEYYTVLPSRITALSGSCVQIPCTFGAPDDMLKNAESIFGCWIKKDHAFLNSDSLVVLNGSTNIIKGFSNIEILGNLSQRECTTVFYDVMNNHTDNYYFRVEMKPVDWKYTYDENPIHISVSGKWSSSEVESNELSYIYSRYCNRVAFFVYFNFFKIYIFTFT